MALGLGLVLGASVLGCGGARPFMRRSSPADIADPVRVEQWESLARPDTLYAVALWMAAADEHEGDCPRIERSGEVVVVSGDCTTDGGVRWTGKARLRKGSDGVVQARLREFGDADGAVTGRVEVHTKGRARYEIDARFDFERKAKPDPGEPRWYAIDAEGAARADGTWDGHGELAAEGRGRVRARAEGIAIDEAACKFEPAGGTLHLRTDAHEVQLRYDGATDCDEVGTAQWWLDGVAQGELTGIDAGMCSVGGRDRSAWGWLWLLGLLRLRRRADADGRVRPRRDAARSRGHGPRGRSRGRHYG